MTRLRISFGTPAGRQLRPGWWRVRRGALAPYRVVDPATRALLPTRVRRALLRMAMRQNGLMPQEAVRHINAVRNYLRNKTGARDVAVRRAYTRDILFLQTMY